VITCAVLVVVVVTTAACASDRADDETASLTVSQPEQPAPPGTLISAEPVDSVPGTRAWKVVHHSRSVADEDISVTGQVIVPDGSPPPGGFPLIAWAHPTTGTSDRCTPSIAGPAEVDLVSELTAAGWAIAATDYEGIGSDLGHPYLVGRSEGRAVLDSARAAAQIEGSGIEPDGLTALAGFSQGGHAALWAAELAPEYAPELELIAVATAAPVTDVAAFARRAEALPEQFGVLVTIVYGFSLAYPELSLEDILTEEARDRLDIAEEACIGEVVEAYIHPIDEMLVETPRTVEGWSDRLEANTAGTERLDLPVLVLQGENDPIVHETVTAEMVERLCRAGDPVDYRVLPGADHGVLRPADLLPWLQARLDGLPATSSC
jgi:dipeptidyl aminopeptidase/acylaminoacyl peptidase